MKKKDPSVKPADTPPMSRREFAVLSVAVGVVAVSGMEAAFGATPVSDSDVQIHTPSGVCDAAFAHPEGKGRWPAAIMFPDAYGLRPTMREMAKRLAAQGYAVLVPNPFYRSTKAPGTGPSFDFQNPDDRAKLAALRAPLTNDGVMQDALALVGFLDSQAVEQEGSDRRRWLLHGRHDDGTGGSGGPRPHRRGRVLPRRRFGDR